MNHSKSFKVTVRRSFSSKLETVFDAWLIPYLAGSWMFGPKSLEQEIVTLENEPRVQGKFLFVVKRNGQEKKFTGKYKEIRRPEKLVCSWGTDQESAERNTLTLMLEFGEGKTRMKLVHELDAGLEAGAEAVRSEWISRCKALAELVENQGKQARLFT